MMTPIKIEQFPMLAAAVNSSKGYGKKTLQNVIEILNKHLPTSSIPNPVFQSAKQDLNTAVDVANDMSGVYADAFRAAYKALD